MMNAGVRGRTSGLILRAFVYMSCMWHDGRAVAPTRTQRWSDDSLPAHGWHADSLIVRDGSMVVRRVDELAILGQDENV